VREEKHSAVISPIEGLISDLSVGKMALLLDDEDNENEGDLVVAGDYATASAINFMTTHGRGIICLSVTEEKARHLGLGYMSRFRDGFERTAFTESIDAATGITAGTSARDRARTISVALSPSVDRRDIVSPGHVFPLVARDGGALVRAGHTEAAVDLARLAGCSAAAVICEVMNPDGTMAGLRDLAVTAQRHRLRIGTIEDLIAFRLGRESVVTKVADRPCNSIFGGDVRLCIYRAANSVCDHLALVAGDIDPSKPVLTRIHILNVLKDCLGVAVESQASRMQLALQRIGMAGGGVVVLINDDKGNAPSEIIRLTDAWASGRIGRSERCRRQTEIGIGAQILRDLGARKLILMTDSAAPKLVGLRGFGLEVVGTVSVDSSPANESSWPRPGAIG
jgi:3,4-dihydroxy 2-butanone 4-phosphate synthase/GTP cyclohydrolase II